MDWLKRKPNWLIRRARKLKGKPDWFVEHSKTDRKIAGRMVHWKLHLFHHEICPHIGCTCVVTSFYIAAADFKSTQCPSLAYRSFLCMQSLADTMTTTL
jgi:hypothetical protein